MVSNKKSKIVCPECDSVEEVNIRRYFLVSKEPRIKDLLLEGNLGLHTCKSCGFTGITCIPMIYDDPENDLFVYVCDGDRDTLIEEFHAFLAGIRPEMTTYDYERAISRPFQIVVGLQMLARIVFSLNNDLFCYRMTPGLTEAPMFDHIHFLIIAKEYRLAGRHNEAYEIVRESLKFRYSNSSLKRELGAYALSAGKLADAERYLCEAQELYRKNSHFWEQIVPGEGIVTKIPEEVSLPKLTQKMRPIHQKSRPECSLSIQELAELAGTLLGLFDKAIDKFGEHLQLRLSRKFVQHQLKQLLMDHKEQRRSLKKIVAGAQIKQVERNSDKRIKGCKD